MRQVSLSGTKQKKWGGFFPSALLLAAAIHLIGFALLDLRPDTENTTMSAKKAVTVEYFSLTKKGNAKKTQTVPVKKQSIAENTTPAAKEPEVRKVFAEEKAEPVKTSPPEPVQKAPAEPSVASTPVKVSETKPEISAPVSADVPVFKDTAALEIKYRDQVRDIIMKNKYYPPVARRRGLQGSVTVAFSVLTDGVINSNTVLVSSGYSALDDAALEMLRKSSPLPVPPDEMDFTLPVSFRLN